MNYYEEKILEIKKFIKIDKNKALDLINDEFKMPYIPEKYEVIFTKLADELQFELMEDKKIKRLSREEIIDYMFSEDRIKIASAIDSLRNENIRTFLKDIEKWIFLNPEDKIAQAVIYETLVDQQIDKEIIFGDKKLNPFQIGTLMSQPETKRAFESISISNEQPQVQEASFEELRFYMLKTFPNFIEDGSKLAGILISVVKNLLDNKKDFSEEQLKVYNILKQK